MKLAIGATVRVLSRPSGRDAVGPEIALAAACLVALAAFKLLQPTLPDVVVLPLVVTIFFLMAAVAALWAWLRDVPSRTRQLNYWDVSGLLTLTGLCLAAVIEPEGLVQFVAAEERASD